MSSHARLTYNKVWHILQGDQELREHYHPLVKHTEELHAMYKVLDKARAERAASRLKPKKPNSSSTPNAALSAWSRRCATTPTS